MYELVCVFWWHISDIQAVAHKSISFVPAGRGNVVISPCLAAELSRYLLQMVFSFEQSRKGGVCCGGIDLAKKVYFFP